MPLAWSTNNERPTTSVYTLDYQRTNRRHCSVNSSLADRAANLSKDFWPGSGPYSSIERISRKRKTFTTEHTEDTKNFLAMFAP
jgi:hypothetical protein